MHGGQGRRREVLRNEWNAWRWEPVELGRRRDVEKASWPLAGLGAEFSESVITCDLDLQCLQEPKSTLGALIYATRTRLLRF
jgi:hypothetical protein